jgi:hypothetical protein
MMAIAVLIMSKPFSTSLFFGASRCWREMPKDADRIKCVIAAEEKEASFWPDF